MAILYSRELKASEPAEYQSEVILITEANFLADVRDGAICRGKQLLRFRDPKLIQVSHEGLPGDLFENRMKCDLLIFTTSAARSPEIAAM